MNTVQNYSTPNILSSIFWHNYNKFKSLNIVHLFQLWPPSWKRIIVWNKSSARHQGYDRAGNRCRAVRFSIRQYYYSLPTQCAPHSFPLFPSRSSRIITSMNLIDSSRRKKLKRRLVTILHDAIWVRVPQEEANERKKLLEHSTRDAVTYRFGRLELEFD